MEFSDEKLNRGIDRLLKKYDLTPKSYKYYYMAFTHPSVAKSSSESYELLEFFGDAIVLASVIMRLIKQYPDQEVGILSKTKSRLVCRDSLASIALDLKLEKLIRFDNSVYNQEKKISNNILADVFEALVAAIYLDQSVHKTKKFLATVFSDVFASNPLKQDDDKKSLLQEIVQKNFKELPQYKLIKTVGPDHDRTFHIQVMFRNIGMGKGKGRTKKVAEQEAASHTIKKIDYYIDKIKKAP